MLPHLRGLLCALALAVTSSDSLRDHFPINEDIYDIDKVYDDQYRPLPPLRIIPNIHNPRVLLSDFHNKRAPAIHATPHYHGKSINTFPIGHEIFRQRNFVGRNGNLQSHKHKMLVRTEEPWKDEIEMNVPQPDTNPDSTEKKPLVPKNKCTVQDKSNSNLPCLTVYYTVCLNRQESPNTDTSWKIVKTHAKPHNPSYDIKSNKLKTKIEVRRANCNTINVDSANKPCFNWQKTICVHEPFYQILMEMTKHNNNVNALHGPWTMHSNNNNVNYSKKDCPDKLHVPSIEIDSNAFKTDLPCLLCGQNTCLQKTNYNEISPSEHQNSKLALTHKNVIQSYPINYKNKHSHNPKINYDAKSPETNYYNFIESMFSKPIYNIAVKNNILSQLELEKLQYYRVIVNEILIMPELILNHQNVLLNMLKELKLINLKLRFNNAYEFLCAPMQTIYSQNEIEAVRLLGIFDNYFSLVKEKLYNDFKNNQHLRSKALHLYMKLVVNLTPNSDNQNVVKDSSKECLNEVKKYFNFFTNDEKNASIEEKLRKINYLIDKQIFSGKIVNEHYDNIISMNPLMVDVLELTTQPYLGDNFYDSRYTSKFDTINYKEKGNHPNIKEENVQMDIDTKTDEDTFGEYNYYFDESDEFSVSEPNKAIEKPLSDFKNHDSKGSKSEAPIFKPPKRSKATVSLDYLFTNSGVGSLWNDELNVPKYTSNIGGKKKSTGQKLKYQGEVKKVPIKIPLQYEKNSNKRIKDTGKIIESGKIKSKPYDTKIASLFLSPGYSSHKMKSKGQKQLSPRFKNYISYLLDHPEQSYPHYEYKPDYDGDLTLKSYNPIPMYNNHVKLPNGAVNNYHGVDYDFYRNSYDSNIPIFGDPNLFTQRNERLQYNDRVSPWNFESRNRMTNQPQLDLNDPFNIPYSGKNEINHRSMIPITSNNFQKSFLNQRIDSNGVHIPDIIHDSEHNKVRSMNAEFEFAGHPSLDAQSYSHAMSTVDRSPPFIDGWSFRDSDRNDYYKSNSPIPNGMNQGTIQDITVPKYQIETYNALNNIGKNFNDMLHQLQMSKFNKQSLHGNAYKFKNDGKGEDKHGIMALIALKNFRRNYQRF